MGFATLIIFMGGDSLASSQLSPVELRLYQGRRFIELQARLVARSQLQWSQLVEQQQNNLSGCKAIHRGIGGISALVHCIEFFNNERVLKVVSHGSGSMVHDLNTICLKMVQQAGLVERLVASRALKNPEARWSRCRTAAWEQIYLTSYANMDAEPIKTVAYLRKALRSVAPDGTWSKKASNLLY